VSKRLSILHTHRERLRDPRNLQFNIYLVSFLGVNRLGRGVYHLYPTRAEVKNEWSYTCTPPFVPPVAFYGMTFTQRFRSWYHFRRHRILFEALVGANLSSRGLTVTAISQCASDSGQCLMWCQYNEATVVTKFNNFNVPPIFFVFE
jgi:hypothetical protein